MSIKLSVNKILIAFTAVVAAIALILLASGAMQAKTIRDEQEAENESISQAVQNAVDTCYSVYGRLIMPDEESAKLKIYEENINKEEEPRIKAYIAYSMSEYAAARITALKLKDYMDEDSVIPQDISDGLNDLVMIQNNLSSLLEIQ